MEPETIAGVDESVVKFGLGDFRGQVRILERQPAQPSQPSPASVLLQAPQHYLAPSRIFIIKRCAPAGSTDQQRREGDGREAPQILAPPSLATPHLSPRVMTFVALRCAPHSQTEPPQGTDKAITSSATAGSNRASEQARG